MPPEHELVSCQRDGLVTGGALKQAGPNLGICKQQRLPQPDHKLPILSRLLVGKPVVDVRYLGTRRGQSAMTTRAGQKGVYHTKCGQQQCWPCAWQEARCRRVAAAPEYLQLQAAVVDFHVRRAHVDSGAHRAPEVASTEASTEGTAAATQSLEDPLQGEEEASEGR